VSNTHTAEKAYSLMLVAAIKLTTVDTWMHLIRTWVTGLPTR